MVQRGEKNNKRGLKFYHHREQFGQVSLEKHLTTLNKAFNMEVDQKVKADTISMAMTLFFVF